jgi:tetratricopeptide (TPR) repeat protein
MAKIALRAYNREIETLVERGQIEEAIAHSKYILRFFPKHIETYRLLGKAYIESQRYSEAADVLQRILSVLPDDFVSQIGMSIIREDEGNLDAAIFHMERAHEIQPSNVAVQDELRRLYGRRDGVEPPRLRLTRGALVRLYAKGDLHRQAIAEIRAALAEDPSRYDLEVILARMYFLIDQKVEATDIASRLVSKLPYCLEANRVLADVLPSTSRADDAKTYQQRVFALDPYLAYISNNAPTAALVPDNAVTLDRLEWQPSASGEAEPAWAQDVGITLGEEKEVEAAPDWLAAPTEPEPENGITPPSPQTSSPASFGSTSEIPRAESGQIPDWMQASGWVESSETTEGTAGAVEGIEEEAALGELPDWLKDMAPQTEVTPPSSNEEAKLDWLDAILPPVAEVKSAEAPTAEPETELPLETAAPESSLPQTISELPADSTAISNEPLPDWLTFPVEETSAASELMTGTPESHLPEAQPVEATLEPTEVSSVFSAEESKTEILAGEAVSEAPLPEPPAASLEQPLAAQDETPTIDLEHVEPVSQAEVEAPSLEAPAAEIFAAPAEEIKPPENIANVSEAELTPSETQEVSAPLAAEAELPVSQVAAESEPKLEEQVSTQEPVSQLTEEPQAAAAVPAGEAQPEINDLDAAMAWLESLAAKQGADLETLSTPIDQRSETPPDWVSKEIEQSQAKSAAIENRPKAEPENPVSEMVVEAPAEPTQGPSAEAQVASPESESISTALDQGPAVESNLPPVSPASQNNLVARFAGLDSETTQSIPQDAFANSSLYPFKEFSSLQPAEPAGNIEFKPPQDLAPAVEDQYTQAEKKTSPLVNPEQPTSQEEMDADAAFAWLESLAAQQGADEGTLTTPPEDRITSAPSWVLEQAAEPTELTDASDLLQGSMTLESPAVQEKAEPATSEPGTLSEWLQSEETLLASSLEETEKVASSPEPVEWVEETAEAQWTSEATLPAIPTQPESIGESKVEEPLPAWLQGFDQSPVEPQDAAKPAAVEDLPDWLKDYDTPSEASLTQASDESISISSWLKDQEVPENEQPAVNQVTVEDTQPIKIHHVQPENIVDRESAPAEPVDAAVTEKSKPEAPSTVANPVIVQAQTAMQDGKIEQALNIYNHLIEEGQMLDEVVHDLRDSLYRYPVEISIWQTLGDAYIRSNHIQEALDAYTKAEELLK